MTKVLLVCPPFYRLMGSHYNGMNLGLGYIASVLRDNNHEVRIYNADHYDSGVYLNQRELFQQYINYKSILNNPSDPIWIEIKDTIKDFSPEIVGISFFTGAYKSATNIAQIVKDLDQKTMVVVGGPHPTLDPEGTILHKDFDLVVRGEGEYTLLDIVEGKRKEDIRGLTYKEGNRIIHNPDRPFIKDLDSLPFPAKDLFIGPHKHLDLGYIMTGRGCPFSCSYCASPKIWKNRVRFRTVENVMEELVELSRDNNSSAVYFIDDTFTLNRNRVRKICLSIIDKGLKIKWKCDTRADCIDKELAVLMKQAGCICAKVGVESGSEKILRKINKKESKESMRKAASYIKRAGISLTIYLMLGFPEETDEDLEQTLEFAKELDADYYSLSIFAPYYGTKIYNELAKKGKINDKAWEYFFHQSKDMIINDSLSWDSIDKFLSLNEDNGKGIRI